MLNSKVRLRVALFGSFILSNISVMGTCSIKNLSFYMYCTDIFSLAKPWSMFQSREVIVARVLVQLEVACRFG